MSFKSVVVIGAGPVGLLCAIEARQKFVKDVTVIDKRSGYSRTNVPLLDNSIRKHFVKLGVNTSMGLTTDSAQTSFSKIEEALAEKARQLGVKFLTPYMVEGAMGNGEAKGGRYKSANLIVVECDYERGVYKPKGGARRICVPADLIIVASGGGAAADPLVLKKLEFTFEKLRAKNYGAFGIFEKYIGPAPKSVPAARENGTGVASFQVRFVTEDHNYMLTTLTGCTASEFKLLRQQADRLRDVMSNINKALYTSAGEELKEVDKNVGAFKIAIQRARQMFSPIYPAILVGDAAVTPHPQMGSGYTTGFRGFEEVSKLFQALKKTHRSKDNSIVYQSFNARYELHVSRKAAEGTQVVLSNVKKTLNLYAKEMRTYASTRLTGSGAKAYVESFAKNADILAEQVDGQQKRAKKFYDYLTGKDDVIPPEFDWDETIGALWADIAVTYGEFKRLTKEAELLGPRLDGIKSALRVA